MSDPWFNPSLYAWIPGTVFGGVGGLWGPSRAFSRRKGRGRRWFMGWG
jgi:hypothetical protein